ncbi:hypothetical protein SCHPADRAFT_938160 [Schizopora paradoxa]|uniref:RING-type domain-containing protein n=1 Tax=Schizopora paradoxa TaxID=27342 RepID=A0A0H2SGD1_9AGAM|nr:hypothetical protein SCHPADRAFT_938160 [Schizopora paradoxa]
MSCAPTEPQSTSPKKPRASSERRPLVPVTPQRINSAQKQNRFASSPLTPNSSIVSSPFSPITNVYSSTSTFATPNSSVSSQNKFDVSPAVLKFKSKSLADVTSNWRSRAKENGIKVSADDAADDVEVHSKENVSSFISNHRRSRQALFQTKSTDNTPFISPQAARIYRDEGNTTVPYSTADLSASLPNTPEPSRTSSGSYSLTTPSPQTSNAIVQKLRQRGSLTDPARTRRRETFGSLPMKASPLFDINEDEADPRATFAPYLQSFGSPLTLTANRKGRNGARSVSAPFYNARAFDLDSDDEEINYDEVMPAVRLTKQPALRPIKSADTLPASAIEGLQVNSTEGNSLPVIKSCAVCSASSCTLSVLSPCGHVICSSCLTGALNIIGEKDMRCATCEEKVDDFKLLTPVITKAMDGDKDESEVESSCSQTSDQERESEKTTTLLPSAFENASPGNGKKLFEVVQSLPANYVAQDNLPQQHCSGTQPAVLRIDNVPWDITPSGLREFFKPFALLHAHVLLDPKGKTLSHAYVEVPRDNVRDALRAVQNKTMGKGKRLRGVTVTMSNQGELMRALFPSWIGTFDGAQPTLANLDNNSIARALETGLVTASELDGLMALMRNPKSHFLKVPSLPFYSLLSMLAKIPVDGDSRVFWNTKLRDTLFETVNNALTILISRIGSELHDQCLLDTLSTAAIGCKVFSPMQINHFRNIMGMSPISYDDNSISPSLPYSASSSPQTEDVLTPDDSASVVSRFSRVQGSGMANTKPPRYTQRANNYLSPVNAYGPLVSPTLPHAVLHSPMGFAMPSPQLNSPFMPYASMVNTGMQFSQNPYDSLAHEFGMEPDVMAAIAQRIVASGVPANAMYAGHRM